VTISFSRNILLYEVSYAFFISTWELMYMPEICGPYCVLYKRDGKVHILIL